MSYEDETLPTGPAYVLAIPEGDPILEWVHDNCPSSFPEPEFFRFMFQIGRMTIEQAKTQLKTDTAGVLQAVYFH